MVKIVEHPSPLPLNSKAFERMNLPLAFRGRGDLEALGDDESKKRIKRYLNARRKVLEEGMGLSLIGAPLTGKSWSAAHIMKSFWQYGYSCFFISASELREGVRYSRSFGDDQSVLDRCREIDLLVIDDITRADLEDRFYGQYISNTVRLRKDNQRPTILTTNVPVCDPEKRDPPGFEFMRQYQRLNFPVLFYNPPKINHFLFSVKKDD